jgi:hypothetical protein
MNMFFWPLIKLNILLNVVGDSHDINLSCVLKMPVQTLTSCSLLKSIDSPTSLLFSRPKHKQMSDPKKFWSFFRNILKRTN